MNKADKGQPANPASPANLLQLDDSSLLTEIHHRRQHRGADIDRRLSLSQDFEVSDARSKELKGYAASLEIDSDEFTLRGLEDAYQQLHTKYAAITDTPGRMDAARVLLEGLRQAHRELLLSWPLSAPIRRSAAVAAQGSESD